MPGRDAAPGAGSSGGIGSSRADVVIGGVGEVGGIAAINSSSPLKRRSINSYIVFIDISCYSLCNSIVFIGKAAAVDLDVFIYCIV